MIKPMPRTVLIVEDEPPLNEYLARLLESRGHEPIQLFVGNQVLDSVRVNKPDLILLDLMLPDIDGFTICDQLKRNRETNLIPIVMVTALSDPVSQLRGVRVGANYYLTKPYTTDQLFKAIDEVLDWRKEHTTHGTTGEIHFDIRSESSYLQQVNDLLADLFAHTSLTDRQIKDLRQVVLEMGGNAIEWGNRKNADLLLQITYRIDPGAVTLIIRDQGSGFDPTNVPHAASPDDPIAHLDLRNDLGIREGGFGIMLARGLVDEFRYNEKGNEVTLVKRFKTVPNGGEAAATSGPDGAAGS
jgi:DNA-binding response OmpR family regulator